MFSKSENNKGLNSHRLTTTSLVETEKPASTWSSLTPSLDTGQQQSLQWYCIVPSRRQILKMIQTNPRKKTLWTFQQVAFMKRNNYTNLINNVFFNVERDTSLESSNRDTSLESSSKDTSLETTTPPTGNTSTQDMPQEECHEEGPTSLKDHTSDGKKTTK